MLRVCSYNVGSWDSPKDYGRLQAYNEGKESVKVTWADYKAAERKAASALLAMEIDVFLFQELGDKERPLRQILENKGYKFLGRSGTTVAYKNTFDFIEDCSFEVQERAVAAARLFLRESGERFVFASAHAPGFDYSLVGSGSPMSYDKLAREQDLGNKYCNEVYQMLSQKLGEDQLVLGADLNADRDVCPCRFYPVGEIFEKGSSQFVSSSKDTNVNPSSPERYKRRKLDYFLVNLSPERKREVVEQEVITFKENNGSDHLPIILESQRQGSQGRKVWQLNKEMGNLSI